MALTHAEHDVSADTPKVRVLVANLSSLFLQVVTDLIQQQPDMTLVGYVQDRVDLLVAATEGVDVLVLGAPRVYPPPGICSHLLTECPHLRILVVATQGDAAVLYWLGLRRQRLRTLSSASLVRTIRRAYFINPTV